MLCAKRSSVMLKTKTPALPSRRVVSVRCSAQKSSEEPNVAQRIALPLASMVAAALISGAMAPEEALAAQSRSGGRVGGSAGFQSRRAAPSRNIQTQSAPSVSTTNIVVAPSVSPFGFGMPFGGFGFGYGFGMPIFTPFPFFGPLLSIMFLLLVVNVVFSVVKGFASKGKSKDDQWGDL